MEAYKELFLLSESLAEAAAPNGFELLFENMLSIERACDQVGRAFSGSWLGYHSRVYYIGLRPPPPGAHFSQEWGLISMFEMGTSGDWQEYEDATISSAIFKTANSSDLSEISEMGLASKKVFESAKSDILSILALQPGEDKFLEDIKIQLTNLIPRNSTQITHDWTPKGQIVSRDMVAIGQGNRIPVHLILKSEIWAIRGNFAICSKASDLCAKAASHLERKIRAQIREKRVGTNVFIGHDYGDMISIVLSLFSWLVFVAG